MIAFFKRIFQAFDNVFGRFLSGVDEDEAIVITVFAVAFIVCFFVSVSETLSLANDDKEDK